MRNPAVASILWWSRFIIHHLEAKKLGAQQRSFDLRYSIMVHGIDIPIWKEEAFSLIFNRFKEILKTQEIVLYPVRTNCRTVFTLNWEIWHGSAVAACLQLFKGICGTGLKANTHHCNALGFPWGSNTITDPMLSTAGF